VSREADGSAGIRFVQNQRLRWAIGELIALLIVGGLILTWKPQVLMQSGEVIQAQWPSSLGIGFITLLVVLVAIPLLLLAVVVLTAFGGWISFGRLAGDILGLGLATLGVGAAAFFFIVAMLTKIIVAYLGGRLLTRNVASGDVSAAARYLALALGLFIYIVLRSLPFGVGWLVGFVVTLLGLGAIVIGYRRRGTVMQEAPLASIAYSSAAPQSQ
jgi:hypothetical protein